MYNRAHVRNAIAHTHARSLVWRLKDPFFSLRSFVSVLCTFPTRGGTRKIAVAISTRRRKCRGERRRRRPVGRPQHRVRYRGAPARMAAPARTRAPLEHTWTPGTSLRLPHCALPVETPTNTRTSRRRTYSRALRASRWVFACGLFAIHNTSATAAVSILLLSFAPQLVNTRSHNSHSLSSSLAVTFLLSHHLTLYFLDRSFSARNSILAMRRSEATYGLKRNILGEDTDEICCRIDAGWTMMTRTRWTAHSTRRSRYTGKHLG